MFCSKAASRSRACALNKKPGREASGIAISKLISFLFSSPAHGSRSILGWSWLRSTSTVVDMRNRIRLTSRDAVRLAGPKIFVCFFPDAGTAHLRAVMIV